MVNNIYGAPINTIFTEKATKEAVKKVSSWGTGKSLGGTGHGYFRTKIIFSVIEDYYINMNKIDDELNNEELYEKLLRINYTQDIYVVNGYDINRMIAILLYAIVKNNTSLFIKAYIDSGFIDNNEKLNGLNNSHIYSNLPYSTVYVINTAIYNALEHDIDRRYNKKYKELNDNLIYISVAFIIWIVVVIYIYILFGNIAILLAIISLSIMYMFFLFDMFKILIL